MRPPPRKPVSFHCGTIRRVAIVGMGKMGAAIAAAAVRSEIPVVVFDADSCALETAEARVAEELELLESAAQPSRRLRAANAPRITIATDDAPLRTCDLVVESILENLAAKQQLYARIEPHLAPGAILASNTSTIPIARLATKVADPRRLLGMHFFHPVCRRPLVEIIRGPETSDSAISAATTFVEAIGKSPIVVGDGPGFVVNRLLFPYLAEAFELLLDGATLAEVEDAAAQFGMALGPLRLMDEIGLDTVLLAGRVLWEAFPERIEPSPLLIAMYKAGRWGCKSGRGFFEYAADRGAEQGEATPGVMPLVDRWRRHPARFRPETTIARLLLPMVLEATRIIEEQRVEGPETIDRAAVEGLGFPTAKGGLLRWADQLTARRLLEALAELEPLGPRFQPTALLQTMAADGGAFYPHPA